MLQSQSQSQLQQSGLSLDANINQQVQWIENMLEQYCSLVQRTLADIVPKSIMYFVVGSLREQIHGELTHHVHVMRSREPSLLDDWTQEDSEIAQKRDRATRMYTACTEALQIFANFSSF